MFISRPSLHHSRKPISEPLVSKKDLFPLLKLSFESDLWSLFEQKAPNLKEKNKNLIKNIGHHLNLCASYFEQGLKTQGLTEKKLRPYYDVAREIIRLAKVSLLEQKLIEEEIDSSLLADEFDNINRLLSKTYIAYERIDFALPSDYVNGELNAFQHNFTKKLLPSNSLENESEQNFPLSKYNLEKTRAERVFHHLWKQRLSLIKFNQLTHFTCRESWEKQLKEALYEITNPMDFCQIAKVLDASQILKIVSICCDHTSLSSIFPYILVSADNNTLEEILHCLSYDEELLNSAKKVLNETATSNNEVKKFIEKKFYTIRQTFVDTRNDINKEIDNLCKRFREHLYIHHITSEDLNYIDELLFNLMARKNNVKTLLLIFHDVLENKLTLSLLNQLTITYEQDIARLTEKAPEEVCGNVWKIISDNAFGVHDYTDDDDAFECFALWHLITAESLLNCALVTFEEFEDEIDRYNLIHSNSTEKSNLFDPKEENLHALNSLAIKRLQKLGIHTIGDFETLRIYNVNLLKNFIEQSSQ